MDTVQTVISNAITAWVQQNQPYYYDSIQSSIAPLSVAIEAALQSAQMLKPS